jgi:hypothetical protein
MSDNPSPTAVPTGSSGANADDYGEDYRAHLLEQYKLFVEMMDRTTSRRSATNRYFLSVNTVLLAALAGLSKTGLVNLQLGWIFFVAVAGIVLCYCRPQRHDGQGEKPPSDQRLGPWVPVVPLELAPSLAAGDSKRRPPA